jgi:alpha-glucosidase (family GH31 glycosyl hydrolase)
LFRWGYNSANETFNVVKNYTRLDYPLDAIWNDIDWMNDYIFGTWGPDYGVDDTRALNDHLERNHQKHIQIVDPNIPALLEDLNHAVYHPYVEGKNANIFVRHPDNVTILYGKQWPEVTVAWPDWTNPATEDWWFNQFTRFGKIAGQMGGVWLDMNEPSSFCAGQISASCIGKNDTRRDHGQPIYHILHINQVHHHKRWKTSHSTSHLIIILVSIIT